MKNEQFREIIVLLNELNKDDCVPKSVRLKIKSIHSNLIKEDSISMKVDRSLQELDDLSEDVNIPLHIKSQIWDIVSKLESIPQ
jgi:hypothetical protein|tara:strand:+ start:2835 stop:3086 length:252 start_codon:yes stop_codon:yes gene_type:complete